MRHVVRGLRSLGFELWFFGTTVCYGLAGIPLRLFAPHRALALAQRWARTALAGLGMVGIRVEVTGLERLPKEGPAILGGQHQSAFDTLIWMALLPRPAYVMKRELQRIPLFGPLLVPAGMIPVDRAAGAPALRALLEATEAARRRNRQMVIFPEGTRVPWGERAPLLPGIAAVATRLQLPVYPVATDSGRCWPRGILRKQPGIIHVAIGEPISQPCRREVLLPRLEAYWRNQAETGFQPVDKSVEVEEVSAPCRMAPPG